MWSWRTIARAAAVALATLTAPNLVMAQGAGTITGTVRDRETKAVQDAVQVFVQGTNYGTYTRPNGTYTIVGVPPGTYTVVAKRVGYAQSEVENVVVRIDVTRTVDIEITATQSLNAVKVEAPPVPIIEQGVVGANTVITNETISALPVTSIGEVLALQQGYQEVPQNTNLISLAEERRNTTQPVRVRGSRGGSTVSAIDGVSVNNPITGTQAIQLNTSAVGQTSFNQGYMSPQYGGGLAGIINSVVREGGERFQGSLQYQTSSIAGALGSRPDELQAQHFFNGYIQGPVPGTINKLRYSLSGQIQSQKGRVLKFDDDVNRFDEPDLDPNNEQGSPQTLDIEQGWRAFGGTQNQQIVGKLTFLPNQTLKFTVTGVDQSRQSLSYDRRYYLTYGGDPWNRVTTLMDSLGLSGSRNYQTIIQGSVRDASHMWSARAEKRFSRSNFSFSFGQVGLNRLTCNVWQGVCTEDRYWRPNFNDDFIAPFTPVGVPYSGTDLFYGGEDYTTTYGRLDYVTQLTDHHNVQIGTSLSRHDVVYDEVQGLRGNSGIAQVVNQLYRAKPIEISSYLQDRIEYDFLVVDFGIRYDYGLAKGSGFTNPLNATNATTAREVCNGTAPGISETPFAENGLTGVLACLQSAPNSNGKPTLLDSATKLAQVDDFKEAEARTAFAPRIGVSFPLTEQSSLWFNAGRYTKNPELHNLYRNSGVGTRASDVLNNSGEVVTPRDNFCAANAVKPGTNECHPPLFFNNPDFIGNPNLLLEQSTQYEVGYSANIGRNYAVSVSVYNRDESGLTGIRQNDAIQDIGATYNGISLPSYSAAVNQDFLTSRGIQVNFDRSVSRGSVWGYNVNYGWSRTTENSPPPDRSFEAEDANEVNRGTTLRELVSGSDQSHRFNARINLSYRNEVPNFWGSSFLKNTSVGLTYSWSSGQVYTPVRSNGVSGIVNTITSSDVNSGRGPAQQAASLQYRKSLNIGNAQYGIVVAVTNVFNIENCIQVFNNTGGCNTGVREFSQRRVGNGQGSSSTGIDNPQFRSETRRIRTGLTIQF
jgi:hypothetical protein